MRTMQRATRSALPRRPARKTRARSAVSAIAAVAMASLAIAPLAFAQVDDYRKIQYPPLPEFQFPSPEISTLKNGLKVFLMEDHELPLIELTAMIRTGSKSEPVAKIGLAGLMGTVQRTGGTARMKGDEIDDFLAARAATIETSVGPEQGTASMNCLKGDFDDVFRVFADVLRTPAFAQDKLDLAKVQAGAGIARRNDNVGQVTGREFTRLVYGPNSPYARIPEYVSIGAVSRDDLVAWHQKYYVPNNVLLGVVGDFDAKEMKKKIEAVLGDWIKGSAVAETEAQYRKTPNPGVFFVEKPDVNQTNISIGHLGIEMKNPDYFAVQVLNDVMSGSFASRLFSSIRTKKGLAYSVFGAVGSGFTHPGIFRAGMQTKSSTTGAALEALEAEIDGLVKNPPDDVEVQRAKESILNSFIFNYDSRGKILRQQMTYDYYGFPLDFLQKYKTNVEKVTKEDVARVAAKYLHPSDLTVLVVGHSADFDRKLETFGQVTPVDITIPPPAAGPPGAPAAAAGKTSP